MAAFDFDIGIIGGGAAGLTVASGSAQLGAKTLLIEKEKELGGDCLHFGCVPSKTLIKSAHVYHQMKHSSRYGLPAVELPPVDFRNISDRIRSVIGIIQEHDSAERFCRLGARVEFGDPRFSDEHTIRLNGSTFSAKRWVLATGSSAAAPPIEGLDNTPFITNREIFYLDRLPASMIILGGGPIGIEMAQAFQRLGTRVVVIELGEQILGKEDRDMAKGVEDVLKAEGVVFHLGTEVTAARDLGSEREVTLKHPDGSTSRLKADTLLLALRRANTNGMNLEGIGVDVGRFGIEVDDRLRTSQKHIYAAGDCNGGFQFTHAAGYEGGIVVSNAIFHLPRKTDYTYLPWCTYTDPELANIGMNETMATAKGIDYRVYTEEFRNNDRSLAEEERIGRIKLLLNEKEKPIGVQIFGPQAGVLISEWVAALNGNVKLSTLASAIHPYPTIGEINKKVVGNFFSPKIFSDKIKKGLKFFFSLKGRACEETECV
ncbi:Mercuric ion reductase (EC [Olavius algarvensis associated proteobacterium Delta 3]|nr:Mercuric ion reductase (EC [Olavius algarvensis associated proteobacterium Delta 3]